MIIEDLFKEEKGEPVRAIQAGKQWFGKLMEHLSDDGKLVMNFVSPDEIKESAWFNNKKMQKAFASAFRITTPSLDNVVGVFLKQVGDSALLRNNLNASAEFRKALVSKRLVYRIRKLNP